MEMGGAVPGIIPSSFSSPLLVGYYGMSIAVSIYIQALPWCAVVSEMAGRSAGRVPSSLLFIAIIASYVCM